MAQPPVAAEDGRVTSTAVHRPAAVPVWLAPERFEAADFSPDICVADLRRYVPLPTVKAELQSYLLHLRNKLVEAINEDFGEYVGLSGKLTGLEGAVLRMKQPLLDIQAKLSGVEEAIKSELLELQQGLQRRQEAAAARRTLELMQEVAASTGKVEKLLQEVGQQHNLLNRTSGTGTAGTTAAANGASSSSSSSSEDVDSHCRILERVAGEAARLMYLIERGKQLAFVKTLERRVMGCRMNIDRQLQAALLSALFSRHWSAALHCLRGYLELGEPGRGEEGLRAGLVGPLVRDIVAQVKQQQQQQQHGGGGAAAGQRDSSDALSQVVHQTLSRLRSEADPLLSQLATAGSGLSGIDLLGSVLLAEVSQAVADGMPGVFSPGNPAAFHQHYLAGQALLQQLEGLATSRASVERLRGGSAAAAWAKRWNLAVYFSLVYQDIAGNFEAAAKASQLQRVDAGQQRQQDAPQLQLSLSSCLWSSLQRALSPDVFLLQLSDRFIKLCTQLLVRYDTWLQEVGKHRQEALAAARAAVPGVMPAAPAAAPSASTAPGAGSNSSGAAGPAVWAGSLSADECAVVCADADVIQGLVVNQLCQQLSQLLATLPAELVQQATELMRHTAANVAQHGQQVLLLLGGDVLERCMAMVKQLKGITATYRMTAKGPPVRHSHYVAGVLQPLRQLLDTPGPVAQLTPNLRLLLSRDVIDNVNKRYSSLAEELLITVKKTESSLKRLKKTRPGEAAGQDAAAAGSAAGAASMPDSDKICLQLYLDVQEHGRQINKFGLVAEELVSYTQLLATVTPPDKQQEVEQ